VERKPPQRGKGVEGPLVQAQLCDQAQSLSPENVAAGLVARHLLALEQQDRGTRTPKTNRGRRTGGPAADDDHIVHVPRMPELARLG
jgi:hypothetical protein